MNPRFSLLVAASIAIAPLSAQVANDTAPTSRPAVAPIAQLDQRTPESMLNSIKQHFNAGKVSAIWAGVAPADRTELHGMLMRVAESIDPGAYDAIAGLVVSLGPILESNASFIANHRGVKGAGKDPAVIVAGIEGVGDLLGKLAGSPFGNHATVSKMSEADVGNLFASIGSTLGDLIGNPDLASLDGKVAIDKIGAADIVGAKATVPVTLSGDDDEQEVPLQQVGDKWFFDLSEPLSEIREGVGEMKKMTPQDSMRIKGMIQGMVAPMLKSFEGVESQEEFDEAVQRSFGLFAMLGGGFGR